MPIGQCEHCGREILAPQEVLVWAEDHTYHQKCYAERLSRKISDEVSVETTTG